MSITVFLCYHSGPSPGGQPIIFITGASLMTQKIIKMKGKQNMKKRILSFLLAAIMIVSMLPVTASAYLHVKGIQEVTLTGIPAELTTKQNPVAVLNGIGVSTPNCTIIERYCSKLNIPAGEEWRLTQPGDYCGSYATNMTTSTSKAIPHNRLIKCSAQQELPKFIKKSFIFRLQCNPNQTARQGLSARIKFASANIIFSFAVCFRSPRYRVFRYRS